MPRSVCRVQYRTWLSKPSDPKESMKNIWSSGIRPLLRAAHFGPTVLVVTISFLISASKLSFFDSAKIAIAIFFGQLIVGWSNDLIDFPLDQEAHRISKPLVSGDLEVQVLKVFLALAVMLVLLTSFIAPWGLRGAVIHLLGILIAMSYNLRLKATIFFPAAISTLIWWTSLGNLCKYRSQSTYLALSWSCTSCDGFSFLECHQGLKVGSCTRSQWIAAKARSR